MTTALFITGSGSHYARVRELVSGRLTTFDADPGMMPPGTAVEEAGGVRAIMRPAAGPVVSMDLAFDTAGGYQLSVRAQNDQPGPVDLAVMLDGAQIGVLGYAANDGSWSEQSLLFSVGLPGFHRLALEFAADAYDQELVDAGQDGDRNALVETVSLTKIPAAINRGDVLIDLNFDDLLSSGAADQPRLDRVEGTFAFVFGPGNEIAFPLVFLGDGNYVLEVGGRGARLGNNLALEMDGSLLEDWAIWILRKIASIPMCPLTLEGISALAFRPEGWQPSCHEQACVVDIDAQMRLGPRAFPWRLIAVPGAKRQRHPLRYSQQWLSC